MEINRIGTLPSAKGPTDWFAGTVRIDPLFQSPDPARVASASVTLSRDHAPLGIRIPSDEGEKHWHGATPTTAMTHIAIQERLDGKVVDWMEHVSDEQYRR